MCFAMCTLCAEKSESDNYAELSKDLRSCVRIGSVVGAKADGGQEGLRWVGGTHPTILHVRDSVNIWRY